MLELADRVHSTGIAPARTAICWAEERMARAWAHVQRASLNSAVRRQTGRSLHHSGNLRIAEDCCVVDL